MRKRVIQLINTRTVDFIEGNDFYSYEYMGAHKQVENRKSGYRFTVWAPNAKGVNLVGSFNNWDGSTMPLEKVDERGIWSLFVEGIKEGELYKYEIEHADGTKVFKADPYGYLCELRPATASVTTYFGSYKWGDGRWLGNRRKNSNHDDLPLNIYEVHLGSFLNPRGDNFPDYEEIADSLLEHVKSMGYTHIELMPVTEYPLDDSWGYQATGYFAPTSRYGDCIKFKKFIDKFHRAGIGVILDWVPGHFCKDSHGLYMFDGGHLFEYDDVRMMDNPGWGTANFDLGKNEVRNFLISSAVFWIKEYHIDGLRVDAVSNMVYLDFGREPGNWRPNKDGGNLNYEAMDFLRKFNTVVKELNEGIITVAEESTSLAYVTANSDKGLNFTYKWNMGWMNDTLRYISLPESDKSNNHNLMNFSMMYNYSEKFMLAVSHDEVVYGKKSLLNKMPGDMWQKFAALRCYLTFMYCHPGKKTVFMGTEFGQFSEWNFRSGLDFFLTEQFETHRNTMRFTKKLNEFYKSEPSLWKCDYDGRGFRWIDADNSRQSVLTFIRSTHREEDTLIVICNFKPITYYNYKVGVPYLCAYKQVFNSDESSYGGAGEVMEDVIFPREEKYQNMDQCIEVKVPPLAVLILKVKNN